MNCENARLMLDAYIDGELSADEMRALEDHAKACNACREELEAAKLMKDALAHMDEEIAVPLEAQAAWRRAVRAEAAKKRNRRMLRGVYAAAAALVLVLGLSLGFDAFKREQPVEAEIGLMARARIETDGAEEAAAYSGTGQGDYTVLKKISTDEIEAACANLEVLAAEYSGDFSRDADSCRIEIPYEYMQDFLKAISRIGTEQFSEIVESEAETAVIMIRLSDE